MTQRLLVASLAIGSALLAIPVASAAVTTFGDRAAFEAAAGPDLLRESFEDRPLGLVELPFLALGSGITVNLSPEGAYDVYVTDSQVFSQSSDGANHLAFLFGTGTYIPRFQLPDMALAFGFDLSGYQDLDGSNSFDIELYASGTLVDALTLELPFAIGPDFFGLVSDVAFDEVRLVIEDGGIPGAGDFVGVDLLTVAFVPTPGVLALAAMAGMVGRGRRRRG